MKVVNKSLMINIHVPVKVGELRCDAEFQVCRDLGSRGEVDDIDFLDIMNISYMGIEIKGYDAWNKFKKFHMEMGINWNEAIENEALKSKQDIIDLVNECY